MLSATTLFPAGALSQRSRVSTARPAARGSWAHRRAASSQHAIPSCGNLVSPRPASMASPKKHGRGAAAHASKSEARVSVNLVLWFAQLVAASPLVPLITGGKGATRVPNVLNSLLICSTGVAGAYAGELRTLIQPSPPFFGVWGLLYSKLFRWGDLYDADTLAFAERNFQCRLACTCTGSCPTSPPRWLWPPRSARRSCGVRT